MSSHTYEVSGVIYDTASGQPLSNFKDNNKDFNSDLEWGDRKFRLEPGFKANEGGDKEGKIKAGGGGVRQYYTGVNKVTGEVTVYRAGQFGLQDDPIGTYNSNGEFVPAVAKDGKNFGTITETSLFGKKSPCMEKDMSSFSIMSRQSGSPGLVPSITTLNVISFSLSKSNLIISI